MALQFTVLGSGSKGNASVISVHGKTILVDPGFSARTLRGRLSQVGLQPSQITEAILTHTHSDHANGTALELLAENNVAFWCHASHRQSLSVRDGFHQLDSKGLVRHYASSEFVSQSGLTIAPFELRHGAGRTFGFKFKHQNLKAGQSSSIGYLADVGCWSEPLAQHFLDCNLLALEFNHDVEMTRNSGRHPAVISRNLSDDGHLSNDQAAELLKFILKRSSLTLPMALVLLHISDSCNTIELAEQSARMAIHESTDAYIPVIPALQHQPLEMLAVSYSRMLPSSLSQHQSESIDNPITKPVPNSRTKKKRGTLPNQMELAFPA